MKLIHEKTGQPVNVGDKLTTFRGETVWLQRAEPPACEGKSGYIYVVNREIELSTRTSNGARFYPSVCDLKWVEDPLAGTVSDPSTWAAGYLAWVKAGGSAD